jgi:hypothetical protein
MRKDHAGPGADQPVITGQRPCDDHAATDEPQLGLIAELAESVEQPNWRRVPVRFKKRVGAIVDIEQLLARGFGQFVQHRRL